MHLRANQLPPRSWAETEQIFELQKRNFLSKINIFLDSSLSRMDYVSLGCYALAFVLYLNTLDAGFVYDDR